MPIASTTTDDELLAALGRHIARARLARNLTQAALAHEAGISTRTLARIEAGESAQTINVVRALRVLDLLDGVSIFESEPSPTPIEQVTGKRQSRERASRKSASSPRPNKWTWGDDQKRGVDS